MLAVYVVLYNGTTLWHTIGLIEIVMTCYGGKSKFADAGTFYAVIHRMRQHAEDSSHAKCCYTFKFPLPSLHNLPFLRTPQCIFAKSGILGR